MGKKMFTKRTLPMALAAVLAISPMQVMAASNDLNGHWAEKVITEWQDKGLIKGYADGSFKPNNNVTRAEFVIMMNNALGFETAEDISFADVKAGDWYYNAVAKAVAAGYSKGYADGTFKPGATITRAEAAVMIANAAGLEADETGILGFTDAYAIPGWAKGSIGAAVNAGFMSGYTDGSFGATKSITRAEAVSSLNRVMGGVAVEEEVTEEVVAEDVVVTEDDAVVEDGVVNGNLIIDKEVGEGEVYLNNLEVEGDIIVNGGGDDSIYMKNVKVHGKVRINKKGVRVHMSGDTNVPHMEVHEVANITSENFEGEVGTITIIGNLGTGTRVIVDVPANVVVIEGKSSVAIEADVKTVEVSEDAEGARVEVAKNATVDTIVADAKVTIAGSGKVENLEANADGITVNKNLKVDNTDTAAGVSKPTTSGGSSGGGGSSSGGGSNRPSTPDTPDDGTGDDNTGDDNTGDDNTGDDNTGDDNTGDDNTGDDTDTTAPEVSAINVTTANGVEVTTDAITNYISCEKGAIVETIEITMNEDVVLAEDADKTVYMSGEFEDVTFENEVYGTFTVSGSKITVTPLAGNEEASRVGIMTFTVAKDVLKDKAGNTVNPEFRLDVAAGEAPEVETIEVAGGSVTVDGTALECEIGTVIDSITVTMDEEVFFVDEEAAKGVVSMTAGNGEYGTFTISGKEITITPNGEIRDGATDAEKYAAYNGYAAATGEVTFTVPANTLKDKLGNANTEAYTFTLTVVDSAAEATAALAKTKAVTEVAVEAAADADINEVVADAIEEKLTETVEGYDVTLDGAYDAESGKWTGKVTVTDKENSEFTAADAENREITVTVTVRMGITAYTSKDVIDTNKAGRDAQENDGRYTVESEVSYEDQTFKIYAAATDDLVGDYQRNDKDLSKITGDYGHYVGIALQLALPGGNTLTDVTYNEQSKLEKETVLLDKYTEDTVLFYLNADELTGAEDDPFVVRTFKVNDVTYRVEFHMDMGKYGLLNAVEGIEVDTRENVILSEFEDETHPNDGKFAVDGEYNPIADRSYVNPVSEMVIEVEATGELEETYRNYLEGGTSNPGHYMGVAIKLDLPEGFTLEDVAYNEGEKGNLMSDPLDRFNEDVDAADTFVIYLNADDFEDLAEDEYVTRTFTLEAPDGVEGEDITYTLNFTLTGDYTLGKDITGKGENETEPGEGENETEPGEGNNNENGEGGGEGNNNENGEGNSETE